MLDAPLFEFEGLAASFRSRNSQGTLIRKTAIDPAKLDPETIPLKDASNPTRDIGYIRDAVVTPDGLKVRGVVYRGEDGERLLKGYRAGEDALLLGYAHNSQEETSEGTDILSLSVLEVAIGAAPVNDACRLKLTSLNL